MSNWLKRIAIRNGIMPLNGRERSPAKIIESTEGNAIRAFSAIYSHYTQLQRNCNSLEMLQTILRFLC